MDRSAHLSALIGEIYDAAVDPSLWGVALAGLRDFVGGATAGIVAKDTARNGGALYFDDGSITPEFTALYFDRFVTADPCTAGHFFSTVDRPVSAADIIPRDEFQRTRFYREWAQPQDFVDCLATAIDRSAATAIVLSVMRRSADGMFDAEAAHRMRLIAPHVQRATLIGKAIELKTVKADALGEALDGLSAGVILVTAAGRIVHVNTAAEALLADVDVFRSEGGRLLSHDAGTNRAVAGLVGAAADGDAAIGTGGISMTLTGRSGETYLAHVLPLAAGARQVAARGSSASAAIFVRKAHFAVSTPETIARTYGLTPTELRVLLGIVEIGGAPEIADAFGIAETTVKTHLGRLFSKTGATRQAELVRLVAGFASPVRN